MGHEQRNLALVDKWEELYNNEGVKFVYECYAEDAVVDCPGELLVKDREMLAAIEGAVCDVTPNRRVRIDRKIAEGDVVVLQCTGTSYQPYLEDNFEIRFCAVLTFNDDGLIVNDTSYMNVAVPRDQTQLTAAEWREEMTNRLVTWLEATKSNAAT